MVYDLSRDLDKERFKKRVNQLYGKGSVVEVVEKSFRTTNQNRYVHLLIGVVAMETGNSLEDAKRYYFKEMVNPDLFRIQKTDNFGNTFETLRSSADLTKEEMSTAIDRFRRWGSENGIYLPSPEDEALLQQIAIEMERQKQWM